MKKARSKPGGRARQEGSKPLTARRKTPSKAANRPRAPRPSIHGNGPPPRNSRGVSAEVQRLRTEIDSLLHETQVQQAALIQSQTELELSRDGYADLYDFAPVGYASFDRRGVIRELNLTGAQMLCRRREDLVGRPLVPLLVKADRKEWLELLRRFRAGKTATEASELRLATRDGAPRVIQLVTNPAAREGLAAEHHHFLRAAILEVTAQRQAEWSLALANRRYSAMFNNTSDGVCLHNLEGNILEVNEAYCHLSGYSREELIEMSIRALEAEGSPKEPPPHIQGVIDGGGRHRFESRIRRKDGSILEVDVTCVHLEVEGDRVAIFVRDITERKRAEAALQRSRDREALLAKTISNLLTAPEPQAVVERLCDEVRVFLNCAVFFNFLLDPETRRLRLNACGGVPRSLGCEVERLELDASLCGAAALGACRVLAERLSVNEEPRGALVRSLGIRAYACHPLLGPDNRVLGTLSFGAGDRDTFSAEDLDLMKAVTDHVAVAMLRSETERALRESRNQYQALIETTSDFIWEVDSSGRYTYCSPQMEKLWGLKPKAMVGRTPFEMILPEQRTAAAETFAGLVRSPAPFRGFEFGSHDGQGRLSWVEVSGVPFFDEHGHLRGYRGITRDITQRKAAEMKMRESERLYRAIGESIDFGIWICDPQGRNIYTSDSFLKLVGMRQDQCAEFGWGAALHPEEVLATIAAWKQCVQVGGPWYREHRCRGVDGQWHPVLACGVPVRDDRGQITCWAGINLDISRLKRTEEELTHAKEELTRTNANLESLVAERTAKLHELVGELEHFSYTITHDMRAPLRAMRGYSELLREPRSQQEQERQSEFLRRITISAQRMDALITDALSYSQAIRRDLPLGDVDTGALLRGMLDTYPELQGMRACISIEGDLPIVVGNEAGLTQCFSNLLSNALKFVRPGRVPEIRVWAEEREGWARICVEDKGIGIPAAMLPRVFDMFSRASRDYEGTGIGLALVRKVTQRMGGRVGVESDESSGSRFWIELKAGTEKRQSR